MFREKNIGKQTRKCTKMLTVGLRVIYLLTFSVVSKMSLIITFYSYDRKNKLKKIMLN